MSSPRRSKTVETATGRLARYLLALALVGLPVAQVEAQTPGDPPPAGLPPLPPAPLSVPALSPFGGEEADHREPSGLAQIRPAPPAPTAPFIDQLKANDAAFKVVFGQGRILTTREDITVGPTQALIAVGDPSVVDFTVISARQIRVVGRRIGVTDLSVSTATGQNYSFEIQVVTDLDPLAAQLRASFPDANLRLSHLRESIVVEGQARDAPQVANILQTIGTYLESLQVQQARTITGTEPLNPSSSNSNNAAATDPQANPNTPPPPPTPNGGAATPVPPASTNIAAPVETLGNRTTGRVINLIRVPGAQQVLLKVRVAELNRTALRRIGANFLGVDPSTGAIVGTQIAGPVTAAGTVVGGTATAALSGTTRVSRTLAGSATNAINSNTTVFGIFQDGNFEFTLNALRRNSMLKVLAEPNLVALHGHEASFLAGGEFPVPVPQVSASGVAPTITVRFREFGVRLNFLPYILDDGVINLSVAPEVSQIDFAIATTLVAGGTPVPGLNTRKAQTTVELREGQTLAIAGLMQLTLDGSTDRVPGLGDLPILGPLFSNTQSSRVEKELVVLVTPYLVAPMNKEQVPPTPGDEVKGPNDLEFFFLNRIEGRTGRDFRATTAWDDPFHLNRFLNLQRRYVNGPSGFSN